MTFTKTSQKFGQWADSRANTVFGLGFASEQQLAKVRRRVPAEAQRPTALVSKQSESSYLEGKYVSKMSLSLDNWLCDLSQISFFFVVVV